MFPSRKPDTTPVCAGCSEQAELKELVWYGGRLFHVDCRKRQIAEDRARGVAVKL